MRHSYYYNSSSIISSSNIPIRARVRVGGLEKKRFHSPMISSLTSMFTPGSNGVRTCVRVSQSVVYDKCLPPNTIVRCKNSVSFFSTTGIQHKLTDRIVYLLEPSSNESIIPVGTTQKHPPLITQTQSRTVAEV